jgi:hypothetical protein
MRNESRRRTGTHCSTREHLTHASSPICRFLPILALILLAACTTFRALDSADPAVLGKELETGDRIRATLGDGRRQDLEFQSIEGGAIVGKHVEKGIVGDELRLPCAELRSVEVQRFSWPKSLGLWLGIGLVGLLLFGPPDYDFDFFS